MNMASGSVSRSRSPQMVEAGLLAAERTCEERGIRFTPIRRTVLEALWQSAQPVSAYDLLHILAVRLGRQLSPPTVYRALEFLQEQKLAFRIETINAFVPCALPDCGHTRVFFLCEDCGSSTEVGNPEIEALFATDAAALGFRIGRRVVELQGTCASCSAIGQ